jgi:hypothetical protein
MVLSVKKIYPLFLAIVLITLVIEPGMVTGQGTTTGACKDTNIHHNYATYIAQPNITIDGIDNEPAWHEKNVYTYTMILSNSFDPANTAFQSTLHMKYIFDRTYLYLCAEWNDSKIDTTDMALFCWNINCSNYSSCMFNTAGMKTPNTGERVDNWRFQESGAANGTTGTLDDTCFDHVGWLGGSDTRDTTYGFIYGNWLAEDNHYQLEMKRLMRTPECSAPAIDVEFKENEPVRFSIAIENALQNQEHAISTTCDLNLTTNPLPDNYQPTSPQQDTFPYTTLYIILGIVACGVVVVIVAWWVKIKRGRKSSESFGGGSVTG